MRLSSNEILALKNSFKNIFKSGKIYLFGSRVDDNKKGGDIDLLIVSENVDKKALRKFRLEFFKEFGEQKLDIVVDDGSFKKPFNKLILQKAVLL